MSIRVYKVADVVGNLVILSSERKAGEAAEFLFSLQPVHEPMPGSEWQIELLIGKGSAARLCTLDLPPLLSKSHHLDAPIFLGEDQKAGPWYISKNAFLCRNVLRGAKLTVTR